jgi:hypothetical protein
VSYQNLPKSSQNREIRLVRHIVNSNFAASISFAAFIDWEKARWELAISDGQTLRLIPGLAVNMSPQAAIIVVPKRKTNSDGGTVVLGDHIPREKEHLRRIGKIRCLARISAS